MSKPLSSLVLAASILALASVETPDAQAKQQCRAEIPSNKHGYWSYRIIDGRKCWYEGKPMLSKDLLEWSSEELKRAPKEELKQEVKREPKEEPKQEVKREPKQVLKQVTKEEPKLASREDSKEALSEEDSVQPPAFRTKPERTVAEKPRDPLDAQAWAPRDPDTFEALWRARAQNFR
jgi:hypothetical protein